jgi:hypothetical protein
MLYLLASQIHVNFSILFMNHLLSETTVVLGLCLTCVTLHYGEKLILEKLIASQLFRRVRNISNMTISFVMYICPQRTNRFQPDGFSLNFVFEDLSKICPKKIIFDCNLTRITGTLHKDLHKFMIISRWIILRRRNISTKVIQKIETHILCSTVFSESRAVSEIMWKKHRMHCCVSIATMVTRTRHNVMVYVHCLFYFKNPSLLWRVFHSNLQLSQIHPPHLKITPHFLVVKYIAKIVNPKFGLAKDLTMLMIKSSLITVTYVITNYLI